MRNPTAFWAALVAALLAALGLFVLAWQAADEGGWAIPATAGVALVVAAAVLAARHGRR
ncbi:hypothetical protein [Streptomyces zhihengii]|uniref:hypothetical protein n=1 Tax=Streptomyces zhihengii TaxID=1818004 RepID=UPI0033A6A58F